MEGEHDHFLRISPLPMVHFLASVFKIAGCIWRMGSQDLDTYLGSPLSISHEWPFGRGPTLPQVLGTKPITMVINHLQVMG